MASIERSVYALGGAAPILQHVGALVPWTINGINPWAAALHNGLSTVRSGRNVSRLRCLTCCNHSTFHRSARSIGKRARASWNSGGVLP